VANPPNNDNRKAGIFNRNDAASGTLNDYLFFQNANTTSTTMDYFAHTAAGSNFVAFAPQNYTALTASWLTSRDGFASGGGYYVAVQVAGGAWYSSTTNAANQTALGSVWIDLLASEWVTITEDPDMGNSGADGSLLRGTTPITYATLFSGGQQITGVGFYVDDLTGVSSGQRNVRIDNFTIQDVIPEPSTAFSGTIRRGALSPPPAEVTPHRERGIHSGLTSTPAESIPRSIGNCGEISPEFAPTPDEVVLYTHCILRKIQ
jgi:hypothetical protein